MAQGPSTPHPNLNRAYRDHARSVHGGLTVLAFVALAVLLTSCGTSSPTTGTELPTAPALPALPAPQAVSFNAFTLPLANSEAGPLVAGTDGAVWVAEVLPTVAGPRSKLVRVAASGTMTEYPAEGLHGDLLVLVPGADGAIWFIDGGLGDGGKLGYITSTGELHERALPTAANDPYGLMRDQDGTLWLTEGTPGRLSLSQIQLEQVAPTGAQRAVTIPAAYMPSTPVAGPDGSLWFYAATTPAKVEGSGPRSTIIVHVSPSGAVKTYPLGSETAVSRSRLIDGSDAMLWFAEQSTTADGQKIWVTQTIDRLDPATGTISRFALPTGNSDGLSGQPPTLVRGQDGALWFTDAANNAIGRIALDGTFHEYSLSAHFANPTAIVSTLGQIWFTEPGFNGQTGAVVHGHPAESNTRTSLASRRAATRNVQRRFIPSKIQSALHDPSSHLQTCTAMRCCALLLCESFSCNSASAIIWRSLVLRTHAPQQ